MDLNKAYVKLFIHCTYEINNDKVIKRDMFIIFRFISLIYIEVLIIMNIQLF